MWEGCCEQSDAHLCKPVLLFPYGACTQESSAQEPCQILQTVRQGGAPVWQPPAGSESPCLQTASYLAFPAILAVPVDVNWPVNNLVCDRDWGFKVRLVYRWAEVMGDLRPLSGRPRCSSPLLPCPGLLCPHLLGRVTRSRLGLGRHCRSRSGCLTHSA